MRRNYIHKAARMWEENKKELVNVSTIKSILNILSSYLKPFHSQFPSKLICALVIYNSLQTNKKVYTYLMILKRMFNCFIT